MAKSKEDFRCLYTFVHGIKFSSLRFDEHVQLLLAELKIKFTRYHGPVSWHIEMLRYIQLTLVMVKLRKEGAEKSFFRDAKPKNIFIINQPYSITLLLRNGAKGKYLILRLALNCTLSLWQISVNSLSM